MLHTLDVRKRYVCKLNGEEINKLLTYNKIIDRINQESDPDKVLKFSDIISHDGPLCYKDKDYKGSNCNLVIKWTNGDITTEPLIIIGDDDPVSCAEYGKKHSLLELDGWKKFSRYCNHHYINIFNVNIRKLRTVRNPMKKMFGYKIPYNYKGEMDLDMNNGNNKWETEMRLELGQIDE